MRRIHSILLLFIILSGAWHSSNAQPQLLSDQAQISLITILPGEAPEEYFGHSAIRVYDPVNNMDHSFNYGTFHFDSWFMLKFIYGDLNYFLSIASFPHSLEHYRQRRRPVIEQVLNLTMEQQQLLYNFLLENAREENRYYRYDFLFDNCSTRIRDAMESVFDAEIHFTDQPDPGLTFRELIALYVHHKPFDSFGIDVLLGSKIDRVAEPRETMFLPDYLMEAFDYATITIDGRDEPLVAYSERVLNIDDYKLGNSSPLVSLITWIVFFTGLIFTWRNYQSGVDVQRWIDVPLFAVTGFIGLLITFLWFISLHNVTASNLNLIWAFPTHLIAATLLYRNSKPGKRMIIYLLATAIVSFIILTGWIFWPQYLHPAVFPLILLLLLRSGWITYNSVMSENKVFTSEL
jgi:hypothetical protein